VALPGRTLGSGPGRRPPGSAIRRSAFRPFWEERREFVLIRITILSTGVKLPVSKNSEFVGLWPQLDRLSGRVADIYEVPIA
jgi:hypothetical protein